MFNKLIVLWKRFWFNVAGYYNPCFQCKDGNLMFASPLVLEIWKCKNGQFMKCPKWAFLNK